VSSVAGLFTRQEGPESGKLKKWLLKTLRAGEQLVFAAVICKVWKLAMAL
jgi:hypothetical protein